MVWDTKEDTWLPHENILPRTRSERRLPAVENLKQAVKIAVQSFVKDGCNEKWNCPRVALEDALGSDIGRDQDLAFEEINQLIKTQGVQLRRWKPKDPPLGDFSTLSLSCRHVEGFKAGDLPASWEGKLYEIGPRPRVSKTPQE